MRDRNILITADSFIRADSDHRERGLCLGKPLVHRLLQQKKRREQGKHQVGTALLNDLQARQRLARTTCHDQLAALGTLEARDHITDGLNLVRPERLTVNDLALLAVEELLPVHPALLKTIATDISTIRVSLEHRQRIAAQRVSRGDKQPKRELRPGRGRDEAVDLSLRDMTGIGLRLHRPQLTRVRLSNNIDSDVRAPAPGPVLPQPCSLHLGCVERI
ncbi:unannotated protein [freshwater metagenome]|uniref:Unannotated protein n=1 Tax=freshwater metagenome TaxID=449393 RepID=A0A6J6PUG0_9ZZZZ